MNTCNCHSCELGDPETCFGCPTHGGWCDWFGLGAARAGGQPTHARVEKCGPYGQIEIFNERGE